MATPKPGATLEAAQHRTIAAIFRREAAARQTNQPAFARRLLKWAMRRERLANKLDPPPSPPAQPDLFDDER